MRDSRTTSTSSASSASHHHHHHHRSHHGHHGRHTLHSVEVVLQNYISLPTDVIVRGLLRKLGTDSERMRFLDFVNRIDELYHLRLHARHSGLLKSFELFTTSTSGRNDKRYNDIHHQEDLFLRRLHRMFIKADYSLLSARDAAEANAISFLLDPVMVLPVNKFDTSLFDRFWAWMGEGEGEAGRETARGVAPLCHTIPIYHRGVGVTKRSGMFLLAKLDLLLGLWMRAVPLLVSMLSRPEGDSESPGASRPNADHSVRRITLEDHIFSNIFTLFMPVTIQEPTFKELIIVYRSRKMINKTDPETQPSRIVVKSFRDVPVADYKMVLPHIRILRTGKDVICFTLSVLFLLAYLLYELTDLFDDTDFLPLNWHWSIYVAAIVSALRQASHFLLQKVLFSQERMQLLFNCSLDMDDGVRVTTLEKTRVQDVKEVILAYFFLWQHMAKTLPELDEEIEVFLETLGESVDFEVDDAVAKLFKDGLVSCDSKIVTESTQFRNLTMTRALTRLDHVWSTFHTTRDGSCPYCAYSVGCGEHS